ncbi:hypothetical protein [Bdellovibrio sp. HCB337]|uniref:hypothetical protein n=1 Tax=Bdellovibrio sp. HCB337 TaxID=3394358 RepID=UPI0039A42CF8
MRHALTLALVLLNLLTVSVGNAATGAAHKRKAVANKNAKLGTSFKFDGSALRGKYQSSLNTTATVENDKFLEDLLGGRTQFEDRAQKETERN